MAYWLLQNGVKVMIAACDTFRSGAVEQLKTHCARLQVGGRVLRLHASRVRVRVGAGEHGSHQEAIGGRCSCRLAMAHLAASP